MRLMQLQARHRALDHRIAEMQSYLSDVETQNQELYQELIREAQLEDRAIVLSHRIRTMPAGTERDAAVEELHALLAEIFEIKQNNRYREIAELETLLRSLQERYAAREDLKSEIIEKRMNELVGPHH